MYLSRLCDSMLAEQLDTFGAVLVEGPKWCGKTTTAARQAASEFRIADPADNYRNRRLAQLDVSAALGGERPRLVDEWQEVPATWDAVRYMCDEAGGAPGQFILTGSATPRERQRPVHSGAGRIGRLRMDTMTLQELGISNGKTSLAALFSGSDPAGASSLSRNDVADVVCRGGWPAVAKAPTKRAMGIAAAYIDAVVEEDLVKVDGLARDPSRVRRLITSLARNESTLASNRTIIADTAGLDATPLAKSTVSDYLIALSKMFFVDDIPAWEPALRSPVRIRAAKKRHIVDYSLVAAALAATPERVAGDPKTLGFLFESLVAHDLRVYARVMGAELMHYRDDSNLEVDFIVQRRDGEWGAFEVKLGQAQENEAAANVLALERKMVERGERPPAVKGAIIGIGGIAYRRPDDVCVIPIDTLGV